MSALKALVGAGGLVGLLAGWPVANAVTLNTYTFDFSNDRSSAYSSSMTFQAEGAAPGTVTAYAQTSQGVNQFAGPEDDFGLGRWAGAGLGVKNNWEYKDKHYIDNFGGSTDFVLFDFGQNVKITQIVLSAYGDTDITLGYGSVWNGNLLDIDSSSSRSHVIINPGVDVFSDQWRIFAQLASSSSPANCRRNCDRVDQFKIKSLTVEASNVPLPAAAWLFGSAMLSLVGIGFRRRTGRGLAVSRSRAADCACR